MGDLNRLSCFHVRDPSYHSSNQKCSSPEVVASRKLQFICRPEERDYFTWLNLSAFSALGMDIIIWWSLDILFCLLKNRFLSQCGSFYNLINEYLRIFSSNSSKCLTCIRITSLKMLRNWLFTLSFLHFRFITTYDVLRQLQIKDDSPTFSCVKADESL